LLFIILLLTLCLYQHVVKCSNNSTIRGDINLDVTAIGNNASIDVGSISTIGAVQGNQETNIAAIGAITGNNIGQVETELNVTAVGNNLSVSKTDIYDDDISATVGAVQFNYDSSITATGVVSDNAFGVPRDPAVTVAAIGNNFSSFNGITSSNMQLNVGTTISSHGIVNSNTGNIGPVNVSVTSSVSFPAFRVDNTSECFAFKNSI